MAVRDFFEGLGDPLRGYRLLRKYPELSRYWVWPIVLTFFALMGGFVLSLRYHDALVDWVWAEPVGEGFWVGALSALHSVVEVLVFIVGLLLATFVCAAASSIIAAPFNDALSEAIEERETGRGAPRFSLARLTRDLVRTVRLEVAKLSLYLLVMGPMWVLSWIVPGVGQGIYLVFGALFTAIYFALDYVDWPASRRGLGTRRRVALFRARPARMLGFGLGLSALLFVPFLNLLLMPVAVAGGTRLFLDLEEEGLLDASDARDA